MKTPRKQLQRPARAVVKARIVPVHVVMRGRGNACLGVAGLVTTFLATALLGSGGNWSSWHTGLTLAVASAAAAALACYVAATIRAPRQSVLAAPTPAPDAGDSPQGESPVTHLRPVAVLTSSEQAK